MKQGHKTRYVTHNVWIKGTKSAISMAQNSHFQLIFSQGRTEELYLYLTPDNLI